MNSITEEYDAISERFINYFPGGHSGRRNIPAAMRTIVERAEGSRFWDLKGTEYLDYACAMGPNILGHRHPEYIAALKQSMDSTAMCVGGVFAASENDVIAAEKICQHVPCAERVKFATSGTEAVQAAIRIARAYTGRPYVLMFEDHYHGWLDNVLAFESGADTNGKPYAVASKALSGRAPAAENGTLIIEWNDIDAVETTLKKYGSEIAMIIMEPYASNADGRFPRPNYLEKVRELCDHYGVVLCFDEVLTGFRAGLNSAQGVFGVTPDITTLGKALGGGMPISAVVGKAKVMDVLKQGNTGCGGTYMGHFLSVQGIVATLGILERNNGSAYREIDKVQKKLMSGLDEIARRRGVPMRVQGVTSIFSLLFGADPDAVIYSKADSLSIDGTLGFKFWQLMQEQGVMCAFNRWILNVTHTDKDTEIALGAADKAISKL